MPGLRRKVVPQRSPGELDAMAAAGALVAAALRAVQQAAEPGVSTGELDRVAESVKLAADKGIAILEVGKPELDRMSANGLHQGVALQVPEYQYAHPDDLMRDAMESGTPPLLVALDNITDPRNLGAVIRSTAAFGGHGVLIPQRRSASVTAVAWRTSAGCWSTAFITLTAIAPRPSDCSLASRTSRSSATSAWLIRSNRHSSRNRANQR